MRAHMEVERYTAKLLIDAFEVGKEIRESDFQIVHTTVMKLIPPCTIFPLTTSTQLNRMIAEHEHDWLHFIPNTLTSAILLNRLGSDNRVNMMQAFSAGQRKLTVKLCLTLIEEYNQLGYAFERPDPWPIVFMPLKMTTVHGLPACKSVVYQILFGMPFEPLKPLLKRWSYTILQTITIARLIPLESESPNKGPVCHFCQSSYGVTLQNKKCSHFRYFHVFCYQNFLNAPRAIEVCPLPKCTGSYFTERPAENWIGLLAFSLNCDLCKGVLEEKSVYYYSESCNHIFHKRCAESSRKSSSVQRPCFDPSCSAVFTLECVQFVPRIFGLCQNSTTQ